jgi:hypothetical protein
MAQVDVRMSRKPYSRGESTDARINRDIQMASLCTRSVGENNYKAGKSYQACYTAHGKSNKHANDNLLHDIPFVSAIWRSLRLPDLR